MLIGHKGWSVFKQRRSYWHWTTMLRLLLMFSLVSFASAVTCTQNGKIYKKGESVSDDGCNVCYCEVSGRIVCSHRKCLPKTDSDTCHCNGTNYNSGGMFTHHFSECLCIGRNSFMCVDKWLISKGRAWEDLCSPTGMMYQTRYKHLGSCRRCSCGGNLRLDCEQVKCFPSNGTERVSRKDSCEHNGFFISKDQHFLDQDCQSCKCVGNDHFVCTKISCNTWVHDYLPLSDACGRRRTVYPFFNWLRSDAANVEVREQINDMRPYAYEI